MTGLPLIAFGGMLVSVGIVLGAAALRPAPPRLSVAMAHLNAAPATAAQSASALGVTVGPNRWGWLPAGWARLIEAHLGVSDADLSIVEMTRAQLATRTVSRAGVGLALPAVVTALLALLGARPPVVLPAGFGLGLAIILWVSASREVKTRAATARAQFRAALRSYLTLVAQERAARGSPTEALEESSRSWRAWPFQLIHTEVLRAELAGEPPWDALRTLGVRLGVDQLEALADIVSTAADGAAVFDTLLAEARTLHHAELAAAQAEANATSEALIQPIALLAIGFVLLLLVPPLLRLFNT